VVFFDAHVHLYPAYDRDALLDALAANAARLAPGAAVALALLRREGQGGLAEALADGGGRWARVRTPDEHCAIVSDGRREIHVFAARQVAARERLEALGLFGDADIPDNLPLAESLARLRAAGLLPVLAWGLGKWLGARGRLVRATIAAHAPGDLLLGDSALRPRCWGTPRPMAAARRRGLRVLYGSDPLPRPGEERVVGCYATIVAGDLDPAAPSASLRRLLLDESVALRPAGARHGLLATLRRMR
jgi:hypothetical protein